MRTASSLWMTKNDTFELGDGWGGAPDCVQIVDEMGRVGVSLRFDNIDQIESLASKLLALSLDMRLRTVDVEADYHGSEGLPQ